MGPEIGDHSSALKEKSEGEKRTAEECEVSCCDERGEFAQKTSGTDGRACAPAGSFFFCSFHRFSVDSYLDETSCLDR